MRPILLLIADLLLCGVHAQSDPNITQWLFNTTGATGGHYMAGNSTPIMDNVPVNVQMTQYSSDWIYVHTNGIPAYYTGPFQDGNPSQATDQNAIFKLPRVPQPNTGVLTATNGGNIGVFVNGVALFDFRDGVGWNANTNALCGGPGNPPCPGAPGALQVWNRDAVPAERVGFDCAKGHPAMGNYHHHQNPSAFNLDLVVLSTVCDLYAADGLYAIDSTQHSPLIGFAFDGYPIYGAYAFANADGTGEVVRMKSGYELRNITVRTTYADGTDVADGPAVSLTYPLGYFREDYGFMEHPGDASYLDVHNGRFCVTPEFPDGTYAYFCTVDEHWNSAYPYAIGPTFFGTKTASNVASVSESVTTYDPSNGLSGLADVQTGVSVFPNPSGDMIAVQVNGLLRVDLPVTLVDAAGRLVRAGSIKAGSTIQYLDTRTLYDGRYVVRVGSGHRSVNTPVHVIH